MSYGEQREELHAKLDSVASTRCTRNMPFAAIPVVDRGGAIRMGFDKAHDKDDETVVWPPEERINNIGLNGPTGEHYMNKYQRKLTNPEGAVIVIDVYDVLHAYPSGCPPIDHAIKKLLCTGSRGAKDWETDLQEAIDSLERAKSFPPLPF
jgi:hypothetical protein